MHTYRMILRLARCIHRRLHAPGKVTGIYQRILPYEGTLYRSLGHLLLTRRRERRRIETGRRQRRRRTGYGMQEEALGAARWQLILRPVKTETVDRPWVPMRHRDVIDNKVTQSINFDDSR